MQSSILENSINVPCSPFEDTAHGSRMLKQYVKLLARCYNPEILDMGPVCGNNISFFLDYAAKLHVYDVLAHTNDNSRQPGLAFLIKNLTYKKNSLDGIHLWDMHDHLDNKTFGSMLSELSLLLKPHGLLVMISSNVVLGQQPFFQYLKTDKDLTVMLQKDRSRRLPYFYRTNRDIEKVMKPFERIGSYICTNGVREFLFRRPKETKTPY
jgi:hypothetical protein